MNFFIDNREMDHKKVWKGLKITDNAARQILYLISKDPLMKGLKLSIKISGCAGFSYVMKLIKQELSDDLHFFHQGANIYVSTKDMPYIDGTEIDYVYEGLNQIFKFNNPKSQHTCGCGESFGIE